MPTDTFSDIDISGSYILQIPIADKTEIKFADQQSVPPLSPEILARNINSILDALGPPEMIDPSKTSEDDESDTQPAACEKERPSEPISLDNLGAVIAFDLTSDQTARLKESGADIRPNFWVPSPNPFERQINQLSRDHLHYINIGSPRLSGATGTGIRIGIADTGIDANHPEFAGKNVHFAEFNPFGQLISHQPRDASNHGTHVAGLAAGNTCGVAPGADLSVAGVLMQPDGQGGYRGTSAQILAGVNWLLQGVYHNNQFYRHANVINLSLGQLGYDNYLYQTIAVALRIFNVLTISAIGNHVPPQNNTNSPGNYDVTFAVGATDYQDQPTNFSAWGQTAAHPGLNKPEMAAPGKNIISAIPGGQYQAMDGTSMACPLVAGTAALLLEHQPQYANNAVGLGHHLLRLVRAGTGSLQTGAGRLDLS